MIKVSVIIPVYNVEKYIHACLESVIGQTYRNLEILLVDDGSTDSSGQVCDEWAKKDKRIIVIHKKNGGLSSARNAALDIATGEYIAFVDSDDFAAPTMIEKSVSALNETGADVCMFSHYTTDGETHTPCALPLSKTLYTAAEIKNDVLPRFFGRKQGQDNLMGFVYRQVFKREAIGGLRFRSEREYYAEDIVFDLEFYKNITKFCAVNEPLYYYRYVPTSLSNGYRKDLFEKFHTLLAFMDGYAKENRVEGAQERILERAFVFAIGGCLNVKRGAELTKKEKKSAIVKIAEDPFVTASLQKARRASLKERIFAWLLKRKAAGLILALI